MMMLASPRAGSPDRPRLRLPPQVRVQQILDGALEVFNDKGYAAARMDDIASRCGLSKGGLYAHFDSKEQVFAALLASALQPTHLVSPPDSHAPDEALVDWLLDSLYACFDQPRRRAVLKLLVAEGDRVPDMVLRWRKDVIQPYLDALQSALVSRLDAAGSREPEGTDDRPGTLQEDAGLPGIVLLCQEPWLALSPAIHGLLMHSILPDEARYPGQRIQAAHRAWLLAFLRPGR